MAEIWLCSNSFLSSVIDRGTQRVLETKERLYDGGIHWQREREGPKERTNESVRGENKVR